MSGTRAVAILGALAALAVAGCGEQVRSRPAAPGEEAANVWVAPDAGAGCSRSAAPAAYDAEHDCSLHAAMEAARDGDRIVFKTGSYGTWTGTSKRRLTLAAGRGQSPTMKLDVRGDCCGNVVLDGFRGVGGLAGTGDAPLTGGVTIRDSNFASWLIIYRGDEATEPVVIDHDRFADIDSDGRTDPPGRLMVQENGKGVLIENSTFSGGSSDMIQLNASHVEIRHNRFLNIKDGLNGSINHADPIQVFCGIKTPAEDGCGDEAIDGNYFDQSGGHGANAVAYIGMYDSTYGNRITDNVFRAVDGGPDGHHGIAYIADIASDRGSVIANNTAEPGTCDFSIPCGWISLGHKDEDDPGAGTHVYNNVISGIGGMEGTQSADHNLVAQPLPGMRNVVGTPQFVHRSRASARGFCLSNGSPGARLAADGGAAGIVC
jgi:hypothetical protein